MNMNRCITCLLGLFLMRPVAAVEINQQGLGEVLIYPYYPVNNGLNTLYTLVNTTDQPKAVKISFHEGDVGLEVFSMHVYLRSYDSWSGAVLPSLSLQAGHEDEPTANHYTLDNSIVWYGQSTGGEFFTDVIDADIDPENHHLSRLREGYFQAIEMGVFTGVAAALIEDNTAYSRGVIYDAWETGEWGWEPLLSPTGGLTGGGHLINVNEGMFFSYDALALQNFWEGPGLFTEPGSAQPDLDSGSTTSRVLLPDGTLATSDWSSGYQAVSAVMMQASMRNEYSREASIRARTDWVVSFPTKYFHVTDSSGPVPPFSEAWNGVNSCDQFAAMLYDRASQAYVNNSCCFDPPPPRPAPPEFCHATNVSELLLTVEQPADSSPVLGSDNLTMILGYDDFRQTENGWGLMSFDAPGMTLVPESGVGFQGLPATGFAVQQYTNGGAAEGLLAQYGSLFKHTGRVVTLEAEQ